MNADALEPPTGLRVRGHAFWASTVESYELSAGELEILAEACRTLDALEELAETVNTLGTTVVGSTGQPVLNPAITEARNQRIALHRLLAALNLPADDGSTIETAHQTRAKTANQHRWARTRTA